MNGLHHVINMQSEIPWVFDCRATAALLHAGDSVALAAHVAAILNLLPLSKGGPAAWIAAGSLAVWCAVVYLSVRVKLDARLFELLSEYSAEDLDAWLQASGLRKAPVARGISERRRGAIQLGCGLLFAVVVEIALVLLPVFRLLA